jgi:hypothetical protein
MRFVIRVQRLIPVLGCVFICYSCSPVRIIKTQGDSDQQTVRVPDKTEVVNNWLPKFVSGSSRHLIIDSSTISISGDSSHSSLVHTTAIYDITLTALADSFSLTATVESLTTDSHLQVPRLGSQMDSVENFHATVSNSGRLSSITGTLSSLCASGVNPVATRILELTLNFPQRHLKVGDKWNDSVSTTSCRGKTILEQQNIYQYQLTDLTTQNGYDLAQIQRSVLTTFRSLPSTQKTQLTTTGTGSSTSVLYVNRKTGMLLRSSERSQLTLTINTARGSYPFTQNIFTQIELH